MFSLSAFSFVKDFLIKIMTDWKLMLLIVVLVIGSYGAYKVHQQNKLVDTLQVSLKNEKDSNIVLR